MSDAAIGLFDTLGYRSAKRLPLQPNTVASFLDAFDAAGTFRKKEARAADWKSVDFLFQLTDDEIKTAGGQGMLAFDSSSKVDNRLIQSYLFFAIELGPDTFTRTDLATITREVNRLFKMPALILFKIADTLTLSVINRRLHKRDDAKDVLEKITLIKDIRIANPHRAHVEILHDLSFAEITTSTKREVASFSQLHDAWRAVLDIETLNNRFYRRVRDWFFLAAQHVEFPNGGMDSEELRNRTGLIRLLTRIMFCWFAKEKKLIPDSLFEQATAERTLKKFDAASIDDGSYYKAILQNLFFPTLSVPLNQREFREGHRYHSKNTDYMDHSRFRHEALFNNSDDLGQLFQDIPFLNGGLFECLDYREMQDGKNIEFRVDGFSDVADKQALVPNALFFGNAMQADLSKAYDNPKKKSVAVDGLFHILNAYKFTVAENTPVEQEIALDPELLGRIFEELLAEYNPETEATARKATGSFYTPRAIVNYMVDASLTNHLAGRLAAAHPRFKADEAIQCIERVVEWSDRLPELSARERQTLADAIYDMTVIDPACGSGAFPMGMLQKLIFVLRKLDTDHERWKERTLNDTPAAVREQTRIQLESSSIEYIWKLALIQRVIYGIDIQPIAAQIAKLRCFIALLVDFEVDNKKENKGVPPLPNLDFKFVAANSLIRPPGSFQVDGLALEDPFFGELAKAAESYFFVREPVQKDRLRKQIEALIAQKIEERERQVKGKRQHLEKAGTVKNKGVDAKAQKGHEAAKKKIEGDIEIAERDMAMWESYRNIFAYRSRPVQFFDIQYFFPEIKTGFDIVIGNPPFVRQEEIKPLKPVLKSQNYECFNGVADLYVYFFERGIQLLKPDGLLCFICSNKYFRSGYGEGLRRYLVERTHLRQLIDFGDADIFTSIAYPSILLAQKTEKPVADSATLALTWQPDADKTIEDFPAVFAEKAFQLPQSELKPNGWRIEGGIVRDLLEKLRAAGKPLGQYCNDRFYYGIKTGLNEAFVVDQTTRDRLIAEHKSSAEILKPFLRGRDVKRWKADSQNLWLIFTRRGIEIKQYPAILNYLKPFKKSLMPGVLGGRKLGSYEWYEIQDNIAYWHEFKQPKIIYQEIATYQSFAWDEAGFFVNNKCFLIPGSEKYLLGILNSSVCWWVLGNIASKLQGGAFAMQMPYVSQIPIPAATARQRTELESLVDQVLALASKDKPEAKSKIEALEQEINARVYRLYDLTPGEIKVIEGST